ncbi:MAG: type II toxin-antitoxin system VapC family toxin [Candidatus Accumulibacter phosphatis]|jgi:tRNA(fMet)-specific endonuclease VapC|uniref:Ribonuclease VapC n=1 Tax=Candidatus Accumulibacter contiguus TaxID=2954381 RepID=A0ABX1T6T7_9PROT|nr:type II toxin-antitoxin system VapC family toxin [Candidatus Accumulibacter contiguus]NMQ05365.1 type II toxin-antitoxin system VapC family toxin [Candidatus Accumulibacter contiguus]
MKAVRYLLDTSICIHAMQGNPALARHLSECYFGDLLLSAISLAELEFGVIVAGGDGAARRAALDAVLNDLVVLPFDAAAARAYAAVRLADPQRTRNALDKLIGAHALAVQATLITANPADFSRIPGLQVENWAS